MSTDSYHTAPDRLAPPPPGCPVHESWSPLSEEYLADPYPIAAQLREDHPVFYAAEMGHVVVTRMDDIEAVFMDPDTYASSNVQDPIFPLAPEAAEVLSAPDYDPQAVMSNRAEPDHGRIRAFTRAGFSVRRLRTLEDYMASRATELIDEMLAGPAPADYVKAVAFPLPAEIVFRFIGFPPTDDLMLKSWCVNRKAFAWGKPTPAEQAHMAEGMLAYWRYCREFVAERHRNRTDDFCSELLDAHNADPEPESGTGLAYREVESIIYGISFAGHDPVTNLLCNTLRCLLPRRDQWEALCDDPSLIPTAVEETLRFDSSQVAWRRVTTRDTELGGVQLPKGTRVFLNFAAANREPCAFAETDRFDVNDYDFTRPDPHRHISFGKGIHFCLGANLARMEARIALEILTQRVPSLRLVPQDYWTFPNITFRGPEELWLDWD